MDYVLIDKGNLHTTVSNQTMSLLQVGNKRKASEM